MIPTTVLGNEDCRLLDRLVDGELTESARADLLRRLDETADGWRHLALAFLEGQSWRTALKEGTSSPKTLVEPAPSQHGQTPRTFAPWLATCAALVLFAFVAGIWSGRT